MLNFVFWRLVQSDVSSPMYQRTLHPQLNDEVLHLNIQLEEGDCTMTRNV
jgi:hypothetical protein